MTEPNATLKPTVDADVRGKVNDVAGAATLALLLEDIAAQTYLKAIPMLDEQGGHPQGGRVQIVDQQHQAILLYALGQYPVPEVFQKTDKAAFSPFTPAPTHFPRTVRPEGADGAASGDRRPGRMTVVTHDSRAEGTEADVDGGRRATLRTISRGLGAAGVGRAGLGAAGGGCLGGMIAGLFAGAGAATATATGGAADAALDIQMLQTASSLETLLIDLYGAALGTGPLGPLAPSAKGLATMTDLGAKDTLIRLLGETQAHHREHRLVFQTLTAELGGIEQNEPNPKYASGVAAADVASPLRLLDYAAVLEKIVADTYVVDLTTVESVRAKEALAGVMAVEAQHLALWRAIGALLRDGTPQLVRIPIGDELVNLPGTLAAIAFPNAIDDVTESSSVAEPESGAVQAPAATTTTTALSGASPTSTTAAP